MALVAKNGGVVMVNFYDGFLDPRKAELALRSRTIEDELKTKYPNDPKRVQSEIDAWRKSNDPGKTPLSPRVHDGMVQQARAPRRTPDRRRCPGRMYSRRVYIGNICSA